MNIQEEIKAAIDRSSSHTEIVKVDAANKTEARRMIAAAVSIAEEADLESASTDSNEGYEVWAGPEGTKKMEWRLRIVIAAE